MCRCWCTCVRHMVDPRERSRRRRFGERERPRLRSRWRQRSSDGLRCLRTLRRRRWLFAPCAGACDGRAVSTCRSVLGVAGGALGDNGSTGGTRTPPGNPPRDFDRAYALRPCAGVCLLSPFPGVCMGITAGVNLTIFFFETLSRFVKHLSAGVHDCAVVTQARWVVVGRAAGGLPESH